MNKIRKTLVEIVYFAVLKSNKMHIIRNIICLLLFSATSLLAGDKNIEAYIDQYQDLAISEMERTGVPASIKLAQGILESNAGRSTLARKANNHFGIKCGSRWNGKTYYLKDDDYKKGKLVKSCFRSYRNTRRSYIAHSDFLLDNSRYDFLFRLKRTDYKKWAKGLKKAGYATSKTYEKKLIRIIEAYKLHEYDRMSSGDEVAKAKNKPTLPTDIFYINDAKMTFAKIGETPAMIAQRTKTAIKRILKYNEEIDLANKPLAVDAKVFIQEKRKNFRGKQKIHIVKEMESMYDISQTYGLCLERLYKKNKMSKGTQPAIGAAITIRGKAKKRPKLSNGKVITPPKPVLIEAKEETQVEMEEEKEDFTPIITAKEKDSTATPIEPEIRTPKEKDSTSIIDKPTNIETRKYHTVLKGETLWRISQKYGTTVEAIKALNDLKNNIISTGTRLRVE
ncbi:MAG: glucosaminidase domain-containing protein [Saprospiraceae bacterium]